MDIRGREIQRRGVGAAFRPVGVDMHALDDSRAAAIPPGRVESFKDFRGSRGQGVYSAGRGESAAWSMTWRRVTRRDRMNDNRSGSLPAWSAASHMRLPDRIVSEQESPYLLLDHFG